MYLTSKELEDELEDLISKYEQFRAEYLRLVKPITDKIQNIKKRIKMVNSREDILFNPQKKRRKKTRGALRKSEYPYFTEWVKKQNEE